MLNEANTHADPITSVPVSDHGSSPVLNAIVNGSKQPDEHSRLLKAYSEWLFYERRLLCMEMYPGMKDSDAFVPVNTGATRYHFPMHPRSWSDEPQPSTRAAAVLDLVGCDWINRDHRGAASTKPDPVLALIEAEKAVWDRFITTDGEESDEAGALAVEALSAAMACQPTTSAGAVASLKLCLARLGEDWIGHPDVEAVFASTIGFLERTRQSVTPAADPIPQLLAREEQLFQGATKAIRRNRKGEGEKAMDRLNAFQNSMMATVPTTVAGFAAILERWHERHGRVSENDGLPYDQFMSLIRAAKGDREPAPADEAHEPVAYPQAAE